MASTMATPTLDDKLDKIRSPGLQSQQRRVVVLQAVDATLKEQNTPPSPTGYFAALLGLLSQSIESGSINSETTSSVVYLLDVVTPYAPQPLLRSKFTQILTLLAPILLLQDAEAMLLRASIGCLESLLLAQDLPAWDLGVTQIGPRRAVAGLLNLAQDAKPKIRKRAQDALKKVLTNPPPSPSLDHPAADMCAHTALATLEDLAAKATQARKTQKKATSAESQHDPALLHLQLVKTIASASGGWPSNKIESLCELLLSIARSGGEYMTVATFDIFEMIFAGMAADDAAASSKLPRLIEIISELRPAANDTQLIPPWLAILSRGYDVSAQLEPEDTFQNLPDLFTMVLAFLESPSHNIRISASECLVSFLANCVPASVIIEPSVYDEKTLEKVAKAAETLLSVKYQAAWPESFNVFGAMFDTLRWRANPAMLTILKAVGDLRSNDSFGGKKEADEVIGRAIRAVGPDAVLSVLPLNLATPAKGQPGRAWMFPLLRDYVSNTNLAHFRAEMADEQLSVELWDSDRASADDVVGKVELSIQKLIQHPGKMFPQVSKLRGVKAESEMPGELVWEVGYFGKTQFRKALRTDGRDVNLPKELKDKKELQDDKGAIDTAEEDSVVHTPPDPLWPSGILSIVVHQIVGLELANITGSQGNRKGREFEPARPEAGEVKEESGKKLPSSYCTILINDELAYKTRTKVVSSHPIFNAGTERFVRDWKSCIVTVAVRDSRNRQHDPIIGVVPLKVSDILQTGSEATRWYPLDGGIGFGRIRISLLFRSCELRLPPSQMGWDIGTFEFLGNNIKAERYGRSKTKVRLRTGGSSASIKRDACTKHTEGEGMDWDISGENKHDKIRLPVRYRYRSPIFFEFYPAGKRHPDAYASLWLQELVDLEEHDFDLPIWKCDNGTRLAQNFITQDNFKDVPVLKVEEVGRLRFRGRFSAGTDRDHIKFVSDNNSRETIETWEACFAEGVRQEEVHSEVPPAIQKLHDESLTHGRDVLAQADEKEKEKWLAKDGTDWTGAFGTDPKDMMDGSQVDLNNDENHDDVSSSDSDSDDSNPDLGISDGETLSRGGSHEGGATSGASDPRPSSAGTRPSGDTTRTTDSQLHERASRSNSPLDAYKEYKDHSRDLHRKHRGLMQWRPVRNMQFAKNEALFAMRKVKKLGALDGRKPDVETEV
ncbi:hypothetical protein BN1723_015231 [Verticillium longisporum]|uniref:C2 domain-containing protein n=1 Tax=Verticillium longisporum TaxID=100787 RepID=A0A0G4MTZ2_VERLO|nr:hypothetical protein BN1723_015231 [Verticillium longisporum]